MYSVIIKIIMILNKNIWHLSLYCLLVFDRISCQSCINRTLFTCAVFMRRTNRVRNLSDTVKVNGSDKNYRVRLGLEPVTSRTTLARCRRFNRLRHELTQLILNPVRPWSWDLDLGTLTLRPWPYHLNVNYLVNSDFPTRNHNHRQVQRWSWYSQVALTMLVL